MPCFQYDSSSQTLSVKYESGKVYDFFDVTLDLYREMCLADNAISFFNTNIWSNFENDGHWTNPEDFWKYFISGGFLFDEPVTVDSRRADEDTPLHVVCRWGDVSAVELLIRAGADVNARGEMADTPLHRAIAFGHCRCASRLLAAGATCDSKNELGFTATEKALQSGNARTIALLDGQAQRPRQM